MSRDTGIYSLSRAYTGPLLHSYVSWVLEEAQRRQIQTLYFLARDGYVLLKIAKMLCRKNRIPIHCRYLYCSRMSLRMPSYHLIGKEAYDLIFLGGYHITAEIFLERAGIPRIAWEQVLKEAELLRDRGKELDSRQIQACRNKMIRSRTFRKWLLHNSKKAYRNTIGYLKQEGLMEQKQAAVVDSGWTGSMQRSLRQLLESAGYGGRITGFYFGLFQCSKDPRDGEYLTWYFSPERGWHNKVLFCNNLLECFLSAPHGMTTGYEAQQDRYVPVCKEMPQGTPFAMIQEQIRGILDGAGMQEARKRTLTKKECEKLLRRLMARPARKEAQIYGRFLFCDDVAEGYLYPLADESQEPLLKESLLPLRLLKRFCCQPAQSLSVQSHGQSAQPLSVQSHGQPLQSHGQPLQSHGQPLQSHGRSAQLFWPYGTAALIRNPVKRRLYWLNEYVSQWGRMFLRKRRNLLEKHRPVQR